MPQNTDDMIQAIAARQHGVVTRRQLIEEGISPGAVERRVTAGRLRPVHRGVYQVGPLRAPRYREMAAVLACGRAARVSHRSASALWRILPVPTATGAPRPVDIILTAGCRKHPGIRIRRIRTLREDETTTLDGIPLTTPTRTLYDLAGSVGRRELERAFAEALALRLTNRDRLRELLDRHAERRGARSLQELLEAGRPVLTRSEAEERFLGLCRKAPIPAPQGNVEVMGHNVDFFWRAERLIAEIDGYAFHSSPASFEADRRRDAELMAAGYRVVRVTWRQIVSEPEAVLVHLAKALVRTPRS